MELEGRCENPIHRAGMSFGEGLQRVFNGKRRDALPNTDTFKDPREAKVLLERLRRHFYTLRPHSDLCYRCPILSIRPRWPALCGGSAQINLRQDQRDACRRPNCAFGVALLRAEQHKPAFDSNHGIGYVFVREMHFRLTIADLRWTFMQKTSGRKARHRDWKRA